MATIGTPKAAKILGLAPNTVAHMVERGELKGKKLGTGSRSPYVYEEEDVLAKARELAEKKNRRAEELQRRAKRTEQRVKTEVNGQRPGMVYVSVSTLERLERKFDELSLVVGWLAAELGYTEDTHAVQHDEAARAVDTGRGATPHAVPLPGWETDHRGR